MRITVLLTLGLLSACSGGSELEELSCGAFHEFAVDATDGVVATSEWQPRLQEIANKAVGSRVEDPARELLAAYTTLGRGRAFNAAADRMSSACDPYRD